MLERQWGRLSRSQQEYTMIEFQKLDPALRETYYAYLKNGGRKCEYSFANLCMWGRQRAAFVEGYLVLFSQFDRKAVYPFPLGQGELLPVLDAIIDDARQRGIPCCITGMDADQCVLLEKYYPGKFRFYQERDTFDYVYDIDDLADLKGRKFQKKRNHLNKFRQNYPDWRTEPVTKANLPQVRELTARWFAEKKISDPDGDLHLERIALDRALSDPEKYGLEGQTLYVNGEMVAYNLGSRLSEDTFDVHFEKALGAVDGAYPAINQAFAAWIRDKYPQVRYLNREDDMGIEGLRKAKLSYNPVFLTEKHWARLWEDSDED